MMAKPKFRRTDGHKYSKLGVRRKKLQRYRKSKGRDNKIRLNMKGHVRNVRIGFRSAKKDRGIVKGGRVIMIYNVEDLAKVKEGMIGVVGKIGVKKKMEIAKQAKERKIELMNLDSEKFLKNIEEKLEKVKEEKEKREKKKKARDKKAKEKEKGDKKKDEKLEEKVDADKKEDTKQDKEKKESTENIKQDKKGESSSESNLPPKLEVNNKIKEEGK